MQRLRIDPASGYPRGAETYVDTWVNTPDEPYATGDRVYFSRQILQLGGLSRIDIKFPDRGTLADTMFTRNMVSETTLTFVSTSGTVLVEEMPATRFVDLYFGASLRPPITFDALDVDMQRSYLRSWYQFTDARMLRMHLTYQRFRR